MNAFSYEIAGLGAGSAKKTKTLQQLPLRNLAQSKVLVSCVEQLDRRSRTSRNSYLSRSRREEKIRQRRNNTEALLTACLGEN